MGVGDREKEGEEGLAWSAKAFLKLPITHTSPHQRVAALGAATTSAGMAWPSWYAGRGTV